MNREEKKQKKIDIIFWISIIFTILMMSIGMISCKTINNYYMIFPKETIIEKESSPNYFGDPGFYLPMPNPIMPAPGQWDGILEIDTTSILRWNEIDNTLEFHDSEEKELGTTPCDCIAPYGCTTMYCNYPCNICTCDNCGFQWKR